jgi:type IV pilus assembly protein PilC
MATTSAPTSPAASTIREFTFEWEGKDRQGKAVRGENRAAGENQLQASLRRQGITTTRIRKRRMGRGKRIKPRDIALFTRQLATMMKAGVPLLQAFDIVGRGNSNPNVSRLLADLRADVETGTSLSAAFRKFPQQFSDLYCNLIEAGEAAGILESILERLATYMEKIEGIKAKIKSALMYPVAVILVAFIVVAVIMVFVIPSFKEVFSSFGAELPAPTRMVIAMSEAFVHHGLLMLGVLVAAGMGLARAWRLSPSLQRLTDQWVLRLPVFGPLVRKSIIARWTRTLATLFAAGVPLVEALDSVGGAAGNSVYREATTGIQHEVSSGVSLTHAMSQSRVFPTMVLQMCAIGEESGSLDHMLGKAADFYEAEVDDTVAGLSSLLEPIIIVFLGSVVGGIVVSMYLPIFKLGQVV